ncbi:MAG: nucleotidyltransferase family protein [Vicinamibacterales bacterium]
MTALIEQHRAALTELCRQYGVRRLYVFGSASTDRLQSSSDLDFLVEMADRQPTASYADRYLDFADALERLMGRRIDLITEQAMRNPYFRREVEATRQLVYGQPREGAAV